MFNNRRKMILKYYIFICVSLYLNYRYGVTGSLSYISTERPVLTYLNPLIAQNVSFVSRRIDRKDPRHYLRMELETLLTIGNNLKLDFYFYQFSTNRYQPSFIEMHFKFCDMIENDSIFGAQLKRNFLRMNVTCPYPPGFYNFTEMAIPYVPKNFPFRKGRIYMNSTITVLGTTRDAIRSYIDMEIKEIALKNKD